MELHPSLFCLFFCLLYFSYLLSKTMGYFSGCLMSSASIQKLFWEFTQRLNVLFDEVVGKKVVFPSYSSATLGPPSFLLLLTQFAHCALALLPRFNSLNWSASFLPQDLYTCHSHCDASSSTLCLLLCFRSSLNDISS